MNRKNVEDLYALTPLQQGMLFHALHSPEADAYAEQVVLTLEGDVRPDAFARAWQAVVDHTPALRTGFVWEGVPQPLQVVYREATVPVRVEDWSDLPATEQDARWSALLADDRAAGWELRRAPLVRLALARTSAREWRFLFSSHHLLMDGWSMALVLGDFTAAYQAAREGRPMTLPRRPAFRDYVIAVGQRDEAKAEAYWRARLGGLDEPMPLPLDRAPARAGRPAEEHGQETVPLSADLAAALAEAARRHRVTASTLAQAAWAVVLARYTGRDEVVFGTTVSGRPPEVPGVEEMVGLFINTVPVRIHVPAAEPVAEWIRVLHDEQAEARDHELSPLARVRAWSGLPGDAPLFESIFVYENYPMDAGGEEPPFVVTSARAAERTNYALSMVVAPSGAAMRATATYDARRLDPERVRALLTGFRAVLEQVVAASAESTRELTPLDAGARDAIAAAGAATASFPVEKPLHALFAERAARTPSATALTFGDESLTYAELDARANRLAHRLVKLGARPDSLVGLCVERSAETIVGILAILKAGAGYLPLDPAYPEDRLAYMLEDSGAEIVVTTSALRGRFPSSVTIVCLQCDAVAIAAEPSTAPAVDVSPDSLAYVIYTSGSTGKPKGVEVTHANVVRLFAATDHWFGFTGDDVWTLFHSYAFDFSVWEIWGALLHGGRLVIVPFDVSRSPEDFHALLERERVTVLNQTPSAFRQLMRVDEETASPRGLALRYVVFGGEALDPSTLRGWTARRGDERPRLVNMYGITETTVHVTYRVVRADDTVDGSSSPIGVPIPDLSVHLLDREGRLVPNGVVGEMYVGGAGVARGYLNRPELTAQRFVRDPFSGDAEARLYRSGDLARRLSDGSLEFLGRADDQVKVRGFRIELGEIESALRDHPAVRDAVVLARGEGEERRLVAWLVGSDVSQSDLRAHLLSRLPDYMVPAAFVFLDALPLTRNGKVDRRALPEPDAAAASDDDAYVAPRTPAEETLARVWAAVLRVERVGVHDDFFALGGDSILSLQVVSRSAREGVRVTPRQVFEHPTVAALAAVAGGAAASAAEQGLVTGPAPLTPVQRWFFAHALENPSHFNLSMVVEAAGTVDPALLERALHQLALHHDAIRLRFTRGADGWAQAGSRDAALPVEVVDLATVAEEERPRAREEAKARAEAGLDLAAGPLLRALLLRGDGPDRVLLATHHLVIDVVSWRVLLEDLETAYAQLRRGEDVRLPPKTTSFRAWATLLERHAASDALRAEAAWWLQMGGAADEAEIPLDHGGGANTAAERDSIAVVLDADDTRALLQEVPAVHRTQVNDALLSALARALAPWTGRGALWVELEGHGREELFDGVDLSRTAGWFTTLFPVRVPVGANDAPVAALASARDALRAVPGRGIGFGVLRWMSPDAALRAAMAALPRPKVSFNYLGRFDQGAAEEGGGAFFTFAAEGPGPDRAPRNGRAHLLDVSAWVSGGRLHVGWAFSRAAHDRATIERLAEAYLAALRALVAASRGDEAAPALPTPADFPLAGLDAARLEALLAAHGGPTAVEDIYPLTGLQEGFLFHARYAPDSEAYVEQTAMTLRGRLDADAWVRAWRAVVARHPILRTAFVAEEGGAPLQVVLRNVEVEVQRPDWSGLSATERAERVAALETEERRRGFDAARAPLLRLALARTGADEHRFVFTFHHLLLDGWSLPRVFGEAGALYEAFRTGTTIDLPAPRPFREHVAWLARQDRGAAEAFWRGALEGYAPPALPGRGARGEAPTVFGEARRTIAADDAAALAAFARRSGLTLNTVFAGAWGLLLSRYTGSDDVAFGSVVSGRPAELEGVEEMVGMFINTVPLRVSVPSAERVVAWLRGVQAWQMDARSHEHAPLAEVQRWSGLPPEVPLFETLYAFENFPMDPGAAADGEAELVGADAVTIERVGYPLVLTVLPGVTPELRLGYDAERFDAATAERILAHLRALVLAIAAAPDATVGELAMLEAEERAAVMAAGAATASFPVAHSLPALFATRVAQSPDAVAVTFAGESVSYGELDVRANRLAHRLMKLGARPDSLVGLFVDRSVETIVGILAILKAGAGYLPLDPAYPEDRLAYMLEDSGAPIVVTTSALRGRLPSGVTIVCLQCDAAAISTEPSTAPSVDVSPDSLAYVIYTSGSTGKPKGVEVTHANVVRLFAATDHWFGFTGDDVWTLFHSYAFDFSVWEIWGALLHGGRLVIVPFDVSRSPEEFHALLERERVTVLNQTPSAFRQLMRVDEEAASPRDLALRYVVFGGEALDPSTLRGWTARRGDERPRLVNMYGITETTVHVTYRVVRTEDTVDGSSSPIGVSIPDLSVHLLDREGRLVPNGVVGEMYVGGAGVARGYLNRLELTAQRFVRDPFSGDAEARLYRSGDLARRLPDGSLEFLGRADDQVKVRGFRIELGEIESALRDHPAVRDAVVLARGEGEERRLAAWLVASDVFPNELRTHLGGRLPEYMVPAAFVFLDALPLTRNGKVDRRALPEPAAEAGAGESRAPETPTQELLAGVWREVLGIENAGPADDFFLLGGHSLLAMRVVARARAVFGAELPVRAVFEAPTLRAMAARIDALRAGGALVPAPPLVPVSRDLPLPLSYGQERLWLMEKMSPGALAYGVTVPLAFAADADAEVLARALAEVVRRHEALRTVFRDGLDGPVQAPLAPYAVDLPVDELRGADLSAAVGEIAARASAERFDLARGPLLRARLLRFDAASLLLVTVHHAAFDGWSARVLERELRALYDAFSRGEPSPLAPLPAQYADFATWQRRWVESGALDGEVEFWRRTLEGAPAVLDLPADRPRPAAATHAGARRYFHLPEEVIVPARALARSEGATLFMVLLAAFDVLMARLSGSDDVVVGTQVAGRTREETEGLIGIFVNGLALRADLSGDPSFREALARVREATLDAYAHSALPFQHLADALRVERTLSHPPVFNVLFLLQTDGSAPSTGGGDHDAAALPDAPVPYASEYELAFELRETGRGVVGIAAYSTELFEHETAARMVAGYLRLLPALLAAPDAPVSAPAAMDDAERERVLHAWNRTDAPADTAPLHRLFEARAAAAPGAAALAWTGGTMTYGELNARANQLARRMRALGVGAETIVALHLERGPDLIAALLAVSKAGGAFLPVDPAYPAERRRWMLEDSAARVVVTTSSLAPDLPESSAAVVALDSAAAETASEDDSNLTVEVDPANAAYVIFTSGSTGRPKGVVVPHRGIGNMAASQAGVLRIGAASRALQFASFSFDAAVAEVAQALLAGACLVLADTERASGDALVRFLRDNEVTAAILPPSLLATLGEPELPALAALMSAGEAVPAEVAARWGAGRTFVNGYGPTETTVCATLSIDPVPVDGRVPIGVSIANARAYVLDAAMRPVPLGVRGELYLGGIGVARGYLGRAGLTAERFVPDPYSGEPGARLYRSGDRARRLASGALDFLGRVDQQVKVRGYRIEPGEVETALLAHPEVRQAVVMARGEGDAARLVAYVTPEVDADALRVYLADRLPAHLVPSVVVALAEMPLTPNDKVDRRALPDPEVESAAFLPPRTPTEEALAEMFAEVLAVDPVGARDDFFHLGGHSLRAMQVLSRIEARWGVTLPMRTFFAAPTVAGLAVAVDAIRPADAPRTAPLSQTRARMHLLAALAGEPLPNAVAALRIAGGMDGEALARAVSDVAARHETLRAYIETRDGEPVSITLPAGAVTVAAEEVDDVDGAAARLLTSESARPFAAGEVFFRIHHLRSGDGDALVCVLHPAVAADLPAAEVAAEIVAAYAAGSAPSPVAASAHAEAYWRARLAGAPELLELPADRPRPAVQRLRGAVETAVLPLAPVRALAAGEEIAPSLVLLAAFGVVLARLSGQAEVVVGARAPGSANLAALRVDLSGAPSFREVLARVRATADEAARADLPLARVLEVVKAPAAAGHAPLFQARMGYAEKVDGVDAAPLPAPAPPAALDLALDAAETADGLALTLAYDADLFDAPRMRELLAQVGAVLFQAAEDIDRPARALTLVTASAREALPDAARALAPEEWRGAVHERFAAAAAAFPAAIAVADLAKGWTYGEVDGAANRVAHRLIERGIRPGEIVAVWAHRSALLPVALLAAWKAGAAFAVLDPAYPAARLAGQARAAAPAALLRIPAAGDVPADVASALAESVRAEIVIDDPVGGMDAAPSISVSPDDLAYLAFTSGTTGAPKAVAGTHRPLAHFFGWYAREMSIGAGDRASLLAGLAHDPLLRDLFAPLTVGGTAVVPDAVRVATPGGLAEWLREAEITVAHLTPAMAQLLTADEDAAPLPALRLACFGGDVLRGGDLARVRALAPNARFLNFYGATETPQAMGVFPIPGDLSGTAPVPLGRGIDGVDLLVLAPAGILAGVGELGEIAVRTPYLSAGYRNDPELTGARFVPNPLTGDPADRVYRTGDLGRYRPDGVVEPAGRADRQVKVRGFRVEPGEVEAALARHPAVREAVADTRGEGEAKRLVAWLTGAGEPPKPAALREHLRGLVPEYMVPAAFVWLDALPLTPNGKLDRRALPDPRAASAPASVAPRTSTEELVAAVWREVLGVETLGVEDDFFARGGSWIGAIQAVARVARALEVALPLETIFAAPTVAGTAALVEAAGGGALAAALAGLDEMSDEELAALLSEIGDEAEA